MKNDWKVTQWKESAGESFAQNSENAIKNCEFYFEVTTEQKEYLEEHFEELDGWFNVQFGLVPHTYKFEPFWNGTADVYTCEAYWGD